MADLAVVFVPGIIGTELIYQGDRIWPGTLLEMVGPYKRMAQLLSLDATPGKIIRQYTPFYSIYDQILDHLNAVLPGRIYECPYDWRLPNEESAKRLRDKVAEAAQNQKEIAIVAHSMGGLISRYYLESGLFDSSSGYKNVKTLITLATPHYGSPFGLAAALGYRKEEFLSADQVYDLASKPEFPSVYQLLPPPTLPFVWRTDSNLDSVDVYAVSTSMVGLGGRKLQKANLDSAMNFWHSFKKPPDLRLFCFLGTHHGMINSISVSMNRGQLQASIPEEVPYSGDGTVPSWSAIWGRSQSLAVGGDHVGMMGDPHLHNTLDQVLGITPPATYAVKFPLVKISLRPRVVEVGAKFVALVRFFTSSPMLKGSLHVEPQAGFSVSGAASQIVAIPVEMATQRSLCLEFALQAPKIPSVYHVTWSEDGRVLAQADLIVQSREPLSADETLQFRVMGNKLK